MSKRKTYRRLKSKKKSRKKFSARAAAAIRLKAAMAEKNLLASVPGERGVKVFHKALSGYLLAIDPSTGSNSSMPGYAIFRAGQLVESGTIEVDVRLNRMRRLFEISRTLREEFEVPDVLAIEYISPRPFNNKSNPGHGMNAATLSALHKAVGAILAALPIDNLVEVPPMTWKKWKPEDYVKSDEADAVCIGLATLGIARELKERTEK